MSKFKICPQCGARHNNHRWGVYCTDSCAIDARYEADTFYRQWDRDNPEYLRFHGRID